MKIVDTDILVDYSRKFPNAVQYLESEIINGTIMLGYHLAYSLEMADSFIAASAIYYRTELVTRNIKDYRFIPGLNIKSPY